MQLNVEIQLPVINSKPLSDRERKWIIQREIFALVETEEGLRKFNHEQYVKFITKYKLPRSVWKTEEGVKKWNKCNRIKEDADIRRIHPMDKRTFGYFTQHLDEEGLQYILSVCKDKQRRGECVTNYIKSLVKYEK